MLGYDLTCNRSTRMRSERESPTKDGPSTGVSFALSQVDLCPKHGFGHLGSFFLLLWRLIVVLGSMLDVCKCLAMI